MTTWKVINRATGELIYAYSAEVPVEHPGLEFATYNHVAEAQEIPDPSKRLTKLQFRNLFTTSEKVTIEIASLDSPAADMSTRVQAASLRVFLADVESATPEPDGTSIDLLDPRTVAGVTALETYGLIPAGRAAEIIGG